MFFITYIVLISIQFYVLGNQGNKYIFSPTQIQLTGKMLLFVLQQVY